VTRMKATPTQARRCMIQAAMRNFICSAPPMRGPG
jgi:hypothetical protein